jgi:hypothetical protein
MNDLDKDIYIKYGQINIRNNKQEIKINKNTEINNQVNFFKYINLTPYCNTSYNIFTNNSKRIVPFNEYLDEKEYCNI